MSFSTPRIKSLLVAFFVFTVSIYVLIYFDAIPSVTNGSRHASESFSSIEPILATPVEHSKTSDQPRVLLVSAYFPLQRSKHSQAAYETWLEHFLGPITTDIYFFTSPAMEPIVRRLRGALPITINTTFTSPFDLPPIHWTKKRYLSMQSRDPEKKTSTLDLYAMRNSKPYLLEQAVLSKPNGTYDYAFWSDAGAFKGPHAYTAWPDASRLPKIWNASAEAIGDKENHLLFFPTWERPNDSLKYWVEAMGPIKSKFSEGSFFGGPPAAIAWYRRTYYKYHNFYLKSPMFVGKDQSLTNAIMVLHPSKFITVWGNNPQAANSLLRPSNGTSSPTHQLLNGESTLGACGDMWYYYQFFLATPRAQAAMKSQFLEGLKWPWSWKAWASNPITWRKDREPCRDTAVLSIESMLKSGFGASWKAPPSTL